MSGGLMSGGRMSGGRLSGGLKSYDPVEHPIQCIQVTLFLKLLFLSAPSLPLAQAQHTTLLTRMRATVRNTTTNGNVQCTK